jgi:hypothetical protein
MFVYLRNSGPTFLSKIIRTMRLLLFLSIQKLQKERIEVSSFAQIGMMRKDAA